MNNFKTGFGACALSKLQLPTSNLGNTSPPNEFFCPISLELMEDPVIACKFNRYYAI